MLDVRGLPEDPRNRRSEVDGGPDSAAVIIRLIDSLYRSDKDLARRLLVGAESELDSELEETALRWRQGRMADLGFADYYEALEVYRELDPASVRVGDATAGARAELRPRGDASNGAALRVPTALAQRLGDTGGSPFARAAQALAAGDEIDDLHFALVALTNRVLAADRIAPGDDDAVAAVLERLAATLDLAIERLAAGDDGAAAQALRTIPLTKLFRLGVSLIGKVRAPRARARAQRAVRGARPRAGGARRRGGAGRGDAPAAAVPSPARHAAGRRRAAVPQPGRPGARDRRRRARRGRAGDAARRWASRPRDVSSGSGALLASDADEAAIDTGVLARTALVKRLLAGAPARFEPLVGRRRPRVRGVAAQEQARAPGAARQATQGRAGVCSPPRRRRRSPSRAPRWPSAGSPAWPRWSRRSCSRRRAPRRRASRPPSRRRDPGAEIDRRPT